MTTGTNAETGRRRIAARRLRSLVSDEATVAAYILDVARDGAPARRARPAPRADAPGPAATGCAAWAPAAA